MSQDVAAALRALEARLDVARVEGDVALFDQVLANDFRTTSPVGAIGGKAQMLADARAGTLAVTSSESYDITIEVLGATAIVRGKARMKARYQGHDISGVYAYTHVYMWRDGRWQVVAAHTSRAMPDWVFILMNRFLTLFRVNRS